jgi:hypothetical protein
MLIKCLICLVLALTLLLSVSASTGNGPATAGGEITVEELPSIFPTLDEMTEILEADFNREVTQDLGQEYEGIDIEKYGLVTGYVGIYGSTDQEQGALMSLGLFETADGATGVFQDMLEGLEPEAEQTFDLGNV